MNKILHTMVVAAAMVPSIVVAQDLPTTPLNFSGVIFANYQYHTAAPLKSFNQFDLERAYLTFQLATSENTQIRVTTDVFQTDSSGWGVRAKYAYLQHTYFKDISGMTSTAQFGMVPTAFPVYEENFWPRWIAPTATDRTGINATADLGVDNMIVFPGQLGELYTGITNGNGYSFSETDRFKDYSARLTFTPMTGGQGMLKTFSLTGWGVIGRTASRFVNQGVGTGLLRDRFGIFAGIHDPNFVLAGDWVTTKFGGERGVSAANRLAYDSTGQVLSAYTVIKPFALMKSDMAQPLGVVFRWDRVKANNDFDPHYTFVVAGLSWDLNPKTAFSVDYQEQMPKDGSIAPTLKTYYFHVRADF